MGNSISELDRFDEPATRSSARTPISKIPSETCLGQTCRTWAADNETGRTSTTPRRGPPRRPFAPLRTANCGQRGACRDETERAWKLSDVGVASQLRASVSKRTRQCVGGKTVIRAVFETVPAGEGVASWDDDTLIHLAQACNAKL